jgi:hypothetical protein
MARIDAKNGIGPVVDVTKSVHGNRGTFVILFSQLSSLAAGQRLSELAKKLLQATDTKEFLS